MELGGCPSIPMMCRQSDAPTVLQRVETPENPHGWKTSLPLGKVSFPEVSC